MRRSTLPTLEALKTSLRRAKRRVSAPVTNAKRRLNAPLVRLKRAAKG